MANPQFQHHGTITATLLASVLIQCHKGQEYELLEDIYGQTDWNDFAVPISYHPVNE